MLLDSGLRKKPTEPQPDLAFVKGIKVERVPGRGGGFMRWVLWGFWGLIILKILLAHWAIARWDMPIASFWVWFPTVLFAGLCTIVFLSRDRTGEGRGGQ